MLVCSEISAMVQAKVEAPGMRGSLVLAAEDAAALARFYGALLGVEVREGLDRKHWRVAWPPGGWVEIYVPSRSRPRPRQPGRLALCLQCSAGGEDPVAVLAAWIDTALRLGARPEEPPRQESFGREAWMLDPEDNRFLLLVS